MTDTRDELLVPDRRVVSIEEAKRERQTPANSAPGSPTAFVTKKEMLVLIGKINVGIGEASLAVGQKVFDQLAEETEEHLRRMHFQILQEQRGEFERRSLRGRWRALLTRLGLRRTPLPPTLMVDAAVALDPGVHAAQREAILAELQARAAAVEPEPETSA
jgi:hypothetical protein